MICFNTKQRYKRRQEIQCLMSNFSSEVLCTLMYIICCHHSNITPNKINNTLYFEVKNQGWFGHSSLIGCMTIPIKEIIEEKTFPLSWYKLLSHTVGKEQYSRIPNDDEVPIVRLLVIMMICYYVVKLAQDQST